MVPPPPNSIIGGQEDEHVDVLEYTHAGAHDDKAGPSTVHHVQGEDRHEVVDEGTLDGLRPQTVHSEQQSSTFDHAVKKAKVVVEGANLEVHQEGVTSNDANFEEGEVPQEPVSHHGVGVVVDNVGGEASRVGSPQAGASARIHSPNFASNNQKLVYHAPDTGEVVVLPRPTASESSSKVGFTGWKPSSPREFSHFVYTKGPKKGEKLDIVTGQIELGEEKYKEQAAQGLVKLVPVFVAVKPVEQDAAPKNYEIQSALGDIMINEFGSNQS